MFKNNFCKYPNGSFQPLTKNSINEAIKLYKFANQYENMSPQEQVIYLAEAERKFKAFDNVPNELWEEEYQKYKEVLNKYQDIKMLRWSEASRQKN